MAKKLNNEHILQNDDGLTLVEIMIATALFSVFVAAFIAGQGYNLFDSAQLKKELLLKDLTEMKINELIVTPPEMKESLTSASKEIKTFEEFPDYTYMVELQKLEIPDLSQLSSNPDEDEDGQQQEVKKKILKIFKDNMEKMIWQLKVTVTHKESKAQFEASTWLFNDKAKLDVGSF